MAGTETITLKLVAEDLMSGNVTKAIGSLDKLAKQGGLVGSVAQGIGQSVGQMINPLSLATKAFDMMATGIGMAVGGLADLGQAYRDDKAEQEQLNNTLMHNISNWRAYTDEIDGAIQAGQRLAFSDTEQRLSLGKLVTATRDARRAITLNRLAMDIARQRGIKLSDASDAVTKAAQGQYKGLKSLGYVIDTTASQTENLASVTLQAADAAETWAGTDQGKFAVRLMEITEAAEANGATFERLDGINKDLALSTLDVANTTVMYGGILMDFLGIGKNAEGQTINQANTMRIYGKALQEIGWSYNKMTKTVTKDYGKIAESVDTATGHMNQSMSDFLTPWRQQWKDAANWAKDPFRPAKFENWLQKRSNEAMRKATQAAEKGKPALAARWLAIANAMQSPVITAVGEIRTSIAEIVRAMLVIDGVEETLGGYSRNGSTGRNPNAGQHNVPGGVEVNGFGGVMPLSAGSSGGASSVIVNVTHIGSMSEADGQNLARTVTPHIQRELARRGGR